MIINSSTPSQQKRRLPTVSTAKFSPGNAKEAKAIASFDVNCLDEIQILSDQIDQEITSLQQKSNQPIISKEFYLQMFKKKTKPDQKEFLKQIEILFETLDKIEHEKKNSLNKILLYQEQSNMSRDQIEMVKQDIWSKHYQNYELIIEVDELELVLGSYKQQHPDEAEKLYRLVSYEQFIKEQSEQLQSQKNVRISFLKCNKILSQLQKDRFVIDNRLIELEKEISLSEMKSNQLISQRQPFQQQLFKDFEASCLWNQVLNIFNPEYYQVKNISELQKLLIQELNYIIEGTLTSSVKSQIQINKKRVECDPQILSICLSFDQIVLNVLHILKQNSNTQGQKEILNLMLQQLQNFHQQFLTQKEIQSQIAKEKQIYQEKQSELQQLLIQQQNFNEQQSKITLDLQKTKKHLTQMQNTQKLLTDDIKQKIDEDCEKMTQMYLQDKEQSIREIRFKYGKQYIEKMINDVKLEFRSICKSQQEILMSKLKGIVFRISKIQQITQSNKMYIEMLDRDLETFQDSLIHSKFVNSIQFLVPLAIKELNNKIKELGIKENEIQLTIQSNYSKITKEEMISFTPIDVKDQLMKLQNLKINLLQLENLIHRKKPFDMKILQEIKKQFQSIYGSTLNYSISKSNSSQPSCTQRAKKQEKTKQCRTDRSVFRSPSAQIEFDISSLTISPHNRSCSQVPQISIELMNDCSMQINNPKEVLDSLELDEPLQTVKKQKDLPSYQLSFNNNKSIMDSYTLQQQSCITASVLEMLVEHKNCIVVYLRQISDLHFDPIEHFERNPCDFGFKLCKLKNDTEKVICFGQSVDKENMESLLMEINLNEIKEMQLGLASQNALKFKSIYQQSKKQIACQDSVALKHLRMNHFPFSIVKKDESLLIEGLTISDQDLKTLKSWFTLKKNTKQSMEKN